MNSTVPTPADLDSGPFLSTKQTLAPMDPPGHHGSHLAATPSAEDFGASITSINTPDVVLTVSYLRDNDARWGFVYILVPASPTQHDSLCGLRRLFNNKKRGVYFVRDPVACTDWSEFMATQRAADTLRDPRVYRPVAFFTSDDEKVKSGIEAANEAAALSQAHTCASVRNPSSAATVSQQNAGAATWKTCGSACGDSWLGRTSP